MFKIVLATGNRDKVLEIKSFLKKLPIKILTLDDFPDCPKTVEDQNTFSGNAYKKAFTVYKYTKLPSLADDSGLEVDFLGGQPGVYSARFAGENASYVENNQKLLTLMKNVPEEERTARFKCALALIADDFNHLTEGSCEGKILNSYRGQQGFGYDPLFLYEPFGLTFAEITIEQKNLVSHRAKAFDKMKEYLKEKLA